LPYQAASILCRPAHVVIQRQILTALYGNAEFAISIRAGHYCDIALVAIICHVRLHALGFVHY
jgi:hypothetical protein